MVTRRSGQGTPRVTVLRDHCTHTRTLEANEQVESGLSDPGVENTAGGGHLLGHQLGTRGHTQNCRP